MGKKVCSKELKEIFFLYRSETFENFKMLSGFVKNTLLIINTLGGLLNSVIL